MNKKYLYKFCNYPKNCFELIVNVTEAASRLNTKLSNLDLNDLNISDYNNRYFGEYTNSNEKRTLHLTKYSFILIQLLSKSSILYKDFVMCFFQT